MGRTEAHSASASCSGESLKAAASASIMFTFSEDVATTTGVQPSSEAPPASLPEPVSPPGEQAVRRRAREAPSAARRRPPVTEIARPVREMRDMRTHYSHLWTQGVCASPPRAGLADHQHRAETGAAEKIGPVGAECSDA
ncbi:hypothetical protein GCM10009823_26280 [Brevibacterium salitolerans]|uniref:Uncharacterized protein n=1 Tax=Brevibacterium salitolerans TaxID=1403566 RepID=A0ABN2X302_9MICO